MKNYVNTLLVFGIFLLLGMLVYLNCHRCASSQQHPLFIDNNGNVVDVYLQREVKNTITANAREIQTCYNLFIEQQDGKADVLTDGMVHLDWEIDRKGKSHNIRVVYSQIPNEELGKCMASKIKQFQFPAPNKNRYAEHKFKFAKQVEQ